MACRNGDLATVNELLKGMTTRRVNAIEESNRSTALHAASYNGHAAVVKRLLEVGADLHTHNRFGLTPEQEASTEEIKDLFEQVKKSLLKKNK